MSGAVSRRSLRVPMADGIYLAADVYFPGTDGEVDDKPRPVILERTPYDKSGTSRSERLPGRPDPLTRVEVAEYFAGHGYAVVMQDCRGRYESEGTFTKYVNEAGDGYDTVNWIAEQPWCNGRIGTMGLSYGAHTQCALAAMAPQGLSCMFLDSGGFSNAYQSGIRQGGAFELKQVTWAYKHALLSPKTAEDPARKSALEAVDIASWMRRLDWTPGNSPLSAAPEYEAYLFEQWKKGVFNGYWKQPALYAEGYYDEFPDIPVAIVCSWFDPYVRASCSNFDGLSARGSSPTHLLLGPWTHGDRALTYAGDVDFGNQSCLESNIADDYLALRLDWFDCHLAQRPGANSPFGDRVTYFRMGGGGGTRDEQGRLRHGGKWRSVTDWPPPESKTVSYFLNHDGMLSSAEPVAEGSCDYLFRPWDPVPTLGGAVTSGDPVMHGGAYDHQELALRDDVLVFETEPVERSVAIAGPVEAELWVSSDAPDTDFTIKLLDVYPPSADYPRGFAMNLTDGIFRMRFRDGWDKETSMSPGQLYKITISAFDVSNIFVPGHRIRAEISSSNYPRFDTNPNTGGAIGDLSGPREAANTVHFGGATPSRLLLRVES